MRRLLFACLSLVAFAFVTAAQAGVVATIDKSSQRMTVSVNGVHKYTWAVSTGRDGYRTPSGTWKAKWLSPNHWSSTWDAPMPWSVFYNGGYAIHGTNAVGSLGQPASHGCTRLAPGNAKAFFRLVQQYGMHNVTIRITN